MLSSAQLQTLKADILADPVLSALPNNSDAAFDIAKAYNTATSHVVWRSTTPAGDIFDSVLWANLTPSDSPDATQGWLNRNMQCQSKQINLQTMLVGRDQISTGKTNVRAGLQDALTSLPSGPSGATQAAGWAQVRIAIQRTATRAEKLFATGAGTQGSPATLGFEGQVSVQDVETARNS